MIIEINGEWYAHKSNGECIGVFTTRSAAVARLLSYEG